MFRRIRFALFIALMLSVTVACSGGGVTAYLALTLPLELSSQLNNVADNLGAGEFGVPIKFNLQSGSGLFDMVDGFFTFLNDAQIPEESTQVAVATDNGELKADFGSIGTITADFDLDGTDETVECSRTTTVPICARFWIDETPLAFLVLVRAAADGAVGQGVLTFVPSLVELAANATEASVSWTSGTASDEVRAFYVGQPTSDVIATKAAITLERDRSEDAATLIMKQSGQWSSNPISNCSESQGVFGWADGAAFISASFGVTSDCSLPIATDRCVNISTAAEAGSPESCAVSVASEQLIDLDGFTAANAQLPDNFPATPPF